MDHFGMKERCQRLQQIHVSLSSEVRLERLGALIVKEIKEFVGAEAAYLYVLDGRRFRLEAALNDRLESRGADWREGVLGRTMPWDSPELGAFAGRTGFPLNIEDVYELDEAVDYVFNPELDQRFADRTRSALIVPMLSREGQTAGVVELYNAGGGQDRPSSFPEDWEPELLALGTQAAVALSNAGRLVHARNVFATLVRYSASAIDARSPYTAGHSRRVAALSSALAEAVNRQDSGPLAGVFFSDEELEELTYAAWLHDIGKIGVREQVLDKTGKLGEDRMALIRCRFKQAALAVQFEYQARLLELHATGFEEESAGALTAELEGRLKELREEIALVVRLNRPDSGGDREMARLEAIAFKEFTDGSGQVRRYLEDFELESLRLRHGNLTPGEYEEMRAHAARTRTIVARIPFTPELARIPEFAGAHHEMLDGSGYPDGLKGDQIPWQARIIGVADIFDALVSPDRPYKEALHLETALSVLKQEAEAGRLDPNLVEVFINEDLAGREEANFRLRPREEF
jgi:HD-GYP domain-containing protein (c-di-GMP phosphodiesterase class II)